MDGKIIQTRCGIPHNNFLFFVDTGSGKLWYDVGNNDSEGYRDYISLEILYGILYFYNKLDFKNFSNIDNINDYLISEYKKINTNLTKSIDTIIDVGSHHGHYTLNFSKISKKVISIEPDSHNFSILKTNIKLNDIDNVEMHNLFVSDKNGTHTFGSEDFYRFNNNLYIENKDCKVICLDELCSTISNNSIIKIDSEGEEIKILRGCQKILNQFKPNIWIELHDFCKEDHTELNKLIDFNKYDILKISRNKNYPEIYKPNDLFYEINYLFFRAKD